MSPSKRQRKNLVVDPYMGTYLEVGMRRYREMQHAMRKAGISGGERYSEEEEEMRLYLENMNGGKVTLPLDEERATYLRNILDYIFFSGDHVPTPPAKHDPKAIKHLHKMVKATEYWT